MLLLSRFYSDILLQVVFLYLRKKYFLFTKKNHIILPDVCVRVRLPHPVYLTLTTRNSNRLFSPLLILLGGLFSPTLQLFWVAVFFKYQKQLNNFFTVSHYI